MIRALFVCAGLLAVTAAMVPGHAVAQGLPHVDSDADHVKDDVDAAPCDPHVSARVFVPADRTWGMMMFEDQWPKRGDFDFNDAVIAWNQVLRYNSNGLLTGLRMELSVMAVGAGAHNGLALRLPNVPRANVTHLTYSVANVVSSVEGEVRLEESLPDATLILSDDLHALFGMTGQREWINTDPLKPALPYVDIVIDVGLNPGHALSAADAPFDLFLFNKAQGTEVHRPRYPGTALMNAAHYNTADDGSAHARWFVTKAGIPFALEFPELTNWAPEEVAIDKLYPGIVQFGLSNGTQAQDFYRALEPGFAYGLALPQPLSAQTAPDVSCFAPEPGVCGRATGKGSLASPVWDLCEFGTASAVQGSGGMWRWTCAGNYSDPTSCNTPQWACHPNLWASCSIPNASQAVQYCNGSGTGYGTCNVVDCAPGHYLSGNQCLPKVCVPGQLRSCNVANANWATETCDNLGSQWRPCTVQSCGNGFTRNGNACVSNSAPATPSVVWPNAPQLYCNGTCSWDSQSHCGQGDADIFCRLRSGSAMNYALNFSTATALPAGGYSCPGIGQNLGSHPQYGGPRYSGGSDVWVQASSILATHGPGTVINNVTCAF